MESPDAVFVDRCLRLSGLTLSPAEIEALRPAVGRALEMLAPLASLELGAVEPAVQYRLF